MNYSTLSACRDVVFDPAVGPGRPLLLDVADPTRASELIGLPNGNVKGEAVKLIRAPLNTAFPMLLSIGATFDTIVSAPTPGEKIPTTDLPKPNIDEIKPTGRRLILGDGPTEAPQIDLGYAVFLVTNALLSSFGEAMLIVGAESLALIEKDALYSRVWTQNRNRGDNLTELYIARDHHPEPGRGNEVLWGRHAIRGQIVNRLTQSPTSLKKFSLVRDEVLRRNAISGMPDWNVFLENNRLRFKFGDYQLNSDPELREIAHSSETLRNQTLVELAVMRTTRDQTRALLKNPKVKVPSELKAAFEDVCRQMAALTAPFTRPSPVQRVAWLDEQSGIECVNQFGPFVPGKSYPIVTQVITGKKMEMRHRPGYPQPEEVLVTGQEVLVQVIETFGDNTRTGNPHAFTQFPITAEMEQDKDYPLNRRHTLAELIQNFRMPDVQDLAEADSQTYLKYRRRLEALQTA